MIFRVWAPKAQRVELALRWAAGQAEEYLPMRSAARGWWSLDVAGAGPGMDYGYRLDGEGPFPDPRSPYQPEGPHRLSRLVDHAAYRWSDAGFRPVPLAAGVVYELHVGAFTPDGTFGSAIERLDDLVALGITHVELMPVAQWSGPRGWGYDGVGLYAPFAGYGGPAGLKQLVEACHARGLAVLLDVVYNHLGPEGNYLERFGPYHSDRLHTIWGAAMNFDGPGSDEVRRYFIDNALMWLRDYHIDGLRLDAVHAILDTSAVHFLEALALEVERLSVEVRRPLVLIAESDLNDPRLVRSREAGGYGLEAQWSDDFHHALHTLLTGESSGYYADFDGWEDLDRTLTGVFAYAGRYSVHRQRTHGRPPTGLPASRFVGFLQNHDQVGNRALGERISHLVGPELARVGAALLLTAPFVPMLFMGEEWAASAPFQYFTSHQDPALGAAVSRGRRSEFIAFGWSPEQVPDPQEEGAFLRSKLDWSERNRDPHAGLLEWHRRLIALRRSHPALAAAPLEETGLRFDRQAGWLVVTRGKVRVAASLSDQERRIPLEDGGQARVLLSSHDQARVEGGAVILPPYGVLISEI